MLSEQKFLEIQELLDSGLSRRNIAAIVGVTRKTVGSIANGKHTLQNKPEKGTGSDYVKTEPVRCPKCGALIVLSPCPACFVQARSQAVSVCSSGSVSLGVDLHGDEKRRYLEVRKNVATEIAAGRRRPLDGLLVDSIPQFS